jgi:hypothetical protein
MAITFEQRSRPRHEWRFVDDAHNSSAVCKLDISRREAG